MRNWLVLGLVLAFAACSPPSPSPPSRRHADDAAPPDPAPPEVAPPEAAPPRCTPPNAPPVAVTEVPGIDVGFDFVFDERHRLVVAHEDGVSWRSADGEETRVNSDGPFQALVSLGNGLVWASSSFNRFLRSEGGVPLQLDWPLPLARAAVMGPDGYLYALTRKGDHIRRINIETGDATYVAVGLVDANDLAVAPGATRIYVSSARSSGIYVVDLAEPGALGTVTAFVELDGVPLPPAVTDLCVGKAEWDPCFLGDNAGYCLEDLGVFTCAVIGCFTRDENGVCIPPYCRLMSKSFWFCTAGYVCDTLNEGDSCNSRGGICVDFGGRLYCDYPEVHCADLELGSACMSYGVPGTCALVQGHPQCVQDACKVGWLSPGDACTTPQGTGFCTPDPWQARQACVLTTCDDLAEGELCFDGNEIGVCVADLAGFKRCSVNNCDVVGLGESCRSNGEPGVCSGNPAALSCSNTCTVEAAGAPCTVGDAQGVCAGPWQSCLLDSCSADNLGAACATTDLRAGTCQFRLDLGRPACVAHNACIGHEGEPCTWGGLQGVCNAESGCEVSCEYNNAAVPCADAERLALSSCYRHRDGDGCGLVGICHGVDLSSMRCDDPGEAARLACMGQWPSTTCVVDGTLGVCGEDGVCRAGERGLAACTGLTAGAACTDTSAGWPRSSHCIDTPLGPACAAVTSDPCDPRGIGERCGDSSHYSCEQDGDSVRCLPQDYSVFEACDVDGAPCGVAGYCQQYTAMCMEPSVLGPPCEGKVAGDPCGGDGWPVMTCEVSPQPGLPLLCGATAATAPFGIGAIAVDACGNVYASQNRSGFIYRISPAGVVTKVAELDAPDVPTLRFGQGSKADVLYAADPAHTRLLELHVGTPGATP